jgi:DNA-binding transcriptional LysR family regulator
MDIQSLRYFLSVSQLGSFTAAARQWETDPTTLSRAITALEQYLNARLLHRSTRSVALTAEGEAFVETAQSMLGQLDAAVERAGSANAQPSGLLRLTASQAFTHARLVPLLPLFQKTYPEIQIDLIVADSRIDLTSERIDLAIRLAPEVTGDFIATKLLTARYRVVASPAYIEAAPPLRHPKDLARHDCVVVDLPGFKTGWKLRHNSDETCCVDVKSSLSVSSPIAQYELTKLGMGPALLPSWLVCDDLKAGTLVNLFPDFHINPVDEDIHAWLIYPSKRFLPRRVRVAIDFLRQHIRD